MSFKFNETMLKVESDKVENSLNTKMQEKECFIEGDKLVGKHGDKSVIPSQSVVLTKNSSIKDIKNFIQAHNRSVYICTGMLTKEAISVIDELAKHYLADNILSGNIRLVGIEQIKVIEYLRATIDISNTD